MATFHYLSIGFRPAPLDVVLDPQSSYTQGCQRELTLVDAAPELVALLEKLTFVAESVAHLRGLEREILPTTDAARELLARIRGEKA